MAHRATPTDRIRLRAGIEEKTGHGRPRRIDFAEIYERDMRTTGGHVRKDSLKIVKNEKHAVMLKHFFAAKEIAYHSRDIVHRPAKCDTPFH